MPLVYRVENEFGEGCYTARKTQSLYTLNSQGKYQYDAFDTSERHPAPLADSMLVEGFKEKTRGIDRSFFGAEIPDGWFFGFTSPEQYRSWFFNDELLDDLQNIGFRLYVYDVPEAAFIAGNSQAAYRKDSATDLTPAGGYNLTHQFPTTEEEDHHDDQD